MSTVIQARVGREKQLYADKFRLVAGVIPYRLKPEAEKSHAGNFVDGLEILMISTPNRDNLVFPKGGWENDETVEEAACREALEEAGVRGTISETRLGIWEFRSKSKENCEGGACRGYMFALKVTEELESYPEQSTHRRRWVSVDEARDLCRYEWMQEALAVFIRNQSTKPSFQSRIFCLLKPSEAERVDSTINVLC